MAFWTVASRATGFLRVAAIAAVLGPTFFGNLFQTVLLLPYLIGELMAGPLIPALLTPHLVHALDRNDVKSAGQTANGFLGIVLPVFVIVAALLAIFAPVLLSVLTLAVDDSAVRAKQISLGVPLLILVLPQVVLCALSWIGIAVQHAYRRFAFPTAAQIIENIGLILILGASALLFGVGTDLNEVTLPHLLFLGLGSTLAVAFQAAAQWWGAYRLGIKLIPIAGWTDPLVRRIARIAVPSAVSSGLGSAGYFVLLVASGQVAGGAIAFQIGIACKNLPIALCAFPVAFAQMPHLSRHFGRGDLQNFRATYQLSLRLALFVALPACAIVLGMPTVIASAISFGEMADPAPILLVAGVLAGLSFAIVGESIFVVARSSAYARLDASTSLQAMLIRVSITLLILPIALSAEDDPTRLWYVGLSYSAGALAAAGFMLWRTSGALPKVPDKGGFWLLANCLVAAITTLPAIVLARNIEVVDSTFSDRLLSAGALLLLSVLLYLGTQYWRRSREFEILSSFAGVPPPTSRPPSSAGATSGSRGANA